MGAWGGGPFDNDDALDWVYLLEDGGGPEVVAAALRAAIGTESSDAMTAATAVAAAAVVGVGLGIPNIDLPDEVGDWLANRDPSDWPSMATDAVRALDRVLTESELRELWDEVEEDSAWSAETRDLRDRIAAAGRI